MSLKRGFLWGKLIGLLVGTVFGALCFSLPTFLAALLSGRIVTEPNWLALAILYGVIGGFLGAAAGAALGTALGILLAWLQMAEAAPTVWLVVWLMAALVTSVLSYFMVEEVNLLLPAVWVWLGGLLGWQGGSLYQNQMGRP